MLGYAVPVPLHAVCALTCKSWRAAILALPPARVDVAAAGVFVRELDVIRCLALRGVASSGAFALDGRGCSQIGARAVRALQRWAHTSLRELRLHELKKGGATLAARQHLLFRSFPNLQVLEIEFCAGLTFATTALPPRTLRSLRVLKLNGATELTTAHVATLIRATVVRGGDGGGGSGTADRTSALRSLYVSGAKRVEGPLRLLVDCGCRLNELCLAQCGRIVPSALAQFLAYTRTTLRWLDLSHCPGVRALAHMPALRTVVLDGTGVDTAAIAQLLVGSGELGELDARGELGAAEAGDRASPLEIVSLRGCRAIDDVSARYLASRCPALRSVALTATGVTDAGVNALLLGSGGEGERAASSASANGLFRPAGARPDESSTCDRHDDGLAARAARSSAARGPPLLDLASCRGVSRALRQRMRARWEASRAQVAAERVVVTADWAREERRCDEHERQWREPGDAERGSGRRAKRRRAAKPKPKAIYGRTANEHECSN